MIVARGLGSGIGLLALGLGLSLTIQVVEPPEVIETPERIFSHSVAPKRAYSALRVVAEFTLQPIQAEGLLQQLEARGCGCATLVQLSTKTAVTPAEARAAASAVALQIPYSATLEPLAADGRKDLTDEEIVALVLSAIQI